MGSPDDDDSAEMVGQRFDFDCSRIVLVREYKRMNTDIYPQITQIAQLERADKTNTWSASAPLRQQACCTALVICVICVICGLSFLYSRLFADDMSCTSCTAATMPSR
ncbi:hypothetical protein [Salinisphaera japonica]|uniref:hypothetical protein n=1 Tax=Salinisphaera japonica TaxID=1304270 RepID=UPI000F4CA185|nr:hypothetical protein [Salinisphaera japonica]